MPPPTPRQYLSKRVTSNGQLLLLMAALVFGYGCRTAKYLDADEQLVRGVNVELKKGSKVANWRRFSLEMEQQIVTKPNGRFLFVAPREYFYLRGRAKGDTSRYRSFIQRIIEEEPAFLESDATAQSVARLRTYMLNRGYFNTEVSASVDTLREHFVEVTYTVDPAGVYRYGAIAYEYPDTNIAKLLEATRGKAVLKTAARVDARDYDGEVARIVSQLRDAGYANLYSNSIAPLDADSVGNTVNATLTVLPPPEAQQHEVFKVGRVTVFPDHDPLATTQSLAVDTTVNNIRFIYEDAALRVKPGAIAENIFLITGSLFSQTALSKTNLQLNGLGVFRFVSIRQEPSPVDSQAIDYYIELSRSQRWEIGGDVETSFTDRQAVTGGRLSLIGAQVSGSLSNRNIAGGAERLSLSANAGLEFNFADITNPNIQRLNTVELGVNSSYDLPRFLDFFGLYRGLNRIRSGVSREGDTTKVISDNFYQALRERGTTRTQVGATYVSLLNFYTTTTVSAAFGYEVAPRPNERYTVNHIGLEYLQVDPRPAFDTILAETPFLQRSLSDQVFSALLFRDLEYRKISTGASLAGATITYALGLEQSGFEAFLANRTRNAIKGDTSVFRLGNGLDYARYGRLTGSVAATRSLGLRDAVAARILSGAALTFGFERRERDVPYVRQFFGGGNESMRGWQARALGPGGHRDVNALDTGDIDQAKYQQANFKLEVNLEYRRFLTNLATTRLEGAVFVDVGNIWTLSEDPTRPGSQFRFTELRNESGVVINEPFYRQVGVSGGFGLRLDVSYVLLRADVGFKLRNPYPIGGSYWPKNFMRDGQIRRSAFAIGLNYPF